MARAKCKCCGSWLDTKVAIQVSDDGKNRYYCNAWCCTKHSEELIEKAKIKAEYDEICEITKDIFGYEFNGYSLLKREISAWEKLNTREKIIAPAALLISERASCTIPTARGTTPQVRITTTTTATATIACFIPRWAHRRPPAWKF